MTFFLALILLLLPLHLLAASWTPAASLPAARGYHSATPLPNGKVLFVGGWDGTVYRNDAVLYDPATNAMTPAGFVPGGRGYLHTATLLRDGRVLVAGGLSGSTYVSPLAIYDPASGAWSEAGNIVDTRYWHTATLLANGKVLLAGGLGFPQVSDLYDPSTRASTPAPAPATARYDHTATLLPNGKVLLVGGRAPSDDVELASVELFDPATNTWTPAAGLANARFGHTATLLPDGRVMVTGGRSASTAFGATELYDPATNTWSPGAPMTPRFDHAATLLPGGRVLVSGGMNSSFAAIALAELYDAGTNQWYASPAMGESRLAHTATLLATGRVFVAGGSGAPYRSSTELYDPAEGSWSATNAMAQARQRAAATLMPDGGALVAGGSGASAVLATAERYDPAAGTWSARASMATARQAATVTPLADGKLLVAGGSSAAGVTPTTGALASAERYDPATNSWSPAGSLATPRYLHTATMLLDGRVLVVGGENNSAALASVEIYEAGSNAFVPGPSLATARRSHSATLLPNGKVLVAGGTNGTALASAEVFDPVTNSWAPAGNLATARHSHAATLLPDGRVLASGGQAAAAVSSAERYDPATNAWTATGALATARHSHTATLLPSGHVLVVGGEPATASAEHYDPVSATFAAAGALATGRSLHAAVLLPNGKVLVAGGRQGATALAAAEVHDAGRAPVPARQPQLASTSALVGPGAFTATGSGFLPVVTASNGGTADSASNSPVFELQRVEDGQRRYIVNNAAVEITDIAFQGLGAPFPPGPALVRAWVNGVPSAARLARVPAPPSAPGTPVATGGTFATITFTPPAYAGGASVTDYVATASPGGATGRCFGSCTSIQVALAAGTYTFVVRAENAAGVGPASAPSNAVTIAGLPTQTFVAMSGGRRFLDPATLRATVTASGPTPAGSIAFRVDGVTVPGCEAVPLAAGTAECPLPGGLAVGQRALEASYPGGGGYLGSVGTGVVSVAKGLTDSLAYNLRPAFAFVGQPVQVTARVLPDFGAPNGPTGTITVGDGLASCTIPAPGPGTCSLVPTSAGLKTVVATYPGDGNWAAGTPQLAATLSVMPAFAATTRSALITSRALHSATLLLDGRLLVAGGISGTAPQVANATAEIYDPATRAWTATGTLASPRWGHAALQLPNGRVLVAGGTNAVAGGSLLSAGELWDPATGTWIPTAPLFTPRTRPTLVRLDDGKVLVVGGTTDGGTAGATASVELYDPLTNTFVPTGSLAMAREGHTATLLRDGSVLVAGGRNAAGVTLAAAERYDPVTGTWSSVASLATVRRDAAATLLDDGSVLVVAGVNGTFTPLASAERYDPDADAWAPAGSIVGARSGHSLSRLPNGLVVVLGGTDGGGGPLDAWFYDPSTNAWTASGAMPAFRYGHTATWLANGELLIAGGSPTNAAQNVFAWTPATSGWQTLASLPVGVMLGTMTPMQGDRVMVAGGTSGVFCCDLNQTFVYDASLRTWTAGPSMKGARYRHTATLLADHSVLVVGGVIASGSAPPVERYDPRVNAWIAAAPLPARARHTATLLHTGRVLVAGGRDGSNVTLAQAWIYDPVQDAWSAAAPMSTAREEHTATLLANGRVLVTGGSNGSTRLGSAEVYDPVTNTWSPAGARPGVGATDHTATLLANGMVLVAGGYTGSYLLESAALYDPATNAWAAVPSMAFARNGHVAVRLADGTVLVVGGDGTGTTAERYFPLDNVWRSGGVGLPDRTQQHMAVEMTDGSVLIAGGRPTGFAPGATRAVSRFVPGFAPPGSQDSGSFSFTTPYLLPSSALSLSSGGFAPASTASGGGVSASPSNVPVIELLRPDASARRVIPAAQVESFGPTDYLAKIGALAGFPTGPVRVRAWVNGRLGTAGSSRFATPPGRLAAPVALGGAKALLSFAPASYTGGAVVLQYTATASPGGATASCPRPCDRLEFAALPPGTYTFTIVQQTAVGTSPASPPSNAVTIQATPIDLAPATLPVPVPSQPYGPVQFVASNGTPPYTFTVSSGELPSGLTLSSAGVLLGTPLGTGSFTFTVRAQDGRSPASGGPLAGERTYTLTPDLGAVPGAPQSVTAVPGNGRAYVTFAPPASAGGSSITGYLVASNPAGGFDADAYTPSLTHVVTGLTNGVAYTFTVEALNAAGPGPASAPSAPATPGVPILALSGPTPVDLGTVAPGGASQASTLMLTNPGPVGAAISSIATSGDFTVSHGCGPVLLPGSCSLNVQFVPSATGPRNGTLTIASDAAGSPLQRGLQGMGGTLAACAGFGDVAAGDPFCTSVEWLVNRKVTLGCLPGQFCPAAPVVRASMAAFMNRLGSSVTPGLLFREQSLGPIDVDVEPIVCQTTDHAVGTSPRTANVDGVLSAQGGAGGTSAFALGPVASFDGGATWTSLVLHPARQSAGPLQWTSARASHAMDLTAGQIVRFGLRLARDGLQGAVDVAGGRCVLRVRLDNRNGTGAPQDPR